MIQRIVNNKNMMALSAIAILAAPAMAGKPQEVMEWSNGFPSGPHFNMNIHGKKPDFICDGDTSGGGSVFVPEYGVADIQMVQNKKSSVSELVVLDKCASAFDGDAVKVQLPAGEYQVYARVLGKPPKKNDEPRNVTFYPKLVEACNDVTVYDMDGDGDIDVNDLLLVDVNGDGVVDEFDNHDLNNDNVVDQLDVDLWLELFGDKVECTDSDLLGIGMVTGSGSFLQDGQTLDRQKGKSTAVDITNMFLWEGVVFDSSLDLNGDGILNMTDFLMTDIDQNGTVDDPTIFPNEFDLDGNNVVDNNDFLIGLSLLEEMGLYKDFTGEPVWIFDIADIVVYGWDYVNNGAKLVQIRFYPVDATDFE